LVQHRYLRIFYTHQGIKQAYVRQSNIASTLKDPRYNLVILGDIQIITSTPTVGLLKKPGAGLR
jgi:hypothetical protein